MSERSQIVAVWWSLVFVTIFGLTLIFLMEMLPPPAANMPAADVAAWYAERASNIKIGAMIASWTSAAIIPLWIVIGLQIARQERRYPFWGALAMVGGGLTGFLLVFPPIFWGAAAFTLNRSPEITAALHDVGVLLLVTTDQCYIFPWVAMAVISLSHQSMPHSPFPRWFGYFNIWLIFIFEAGALAWLTKTGPFAWEGLFPFWIPFCLFGLWVPVATVLLLKALHAQRRAGERTDDPVLGGVLNG